MIWINRRRRCALPATVAEDSNVTIAEIAVKSLDIVVVNKPNPHVSPASDLTPHGKTANAA